VNAANGGFWSSQTSVPSKVWNAMQTAADCRSGRSAHLRDLQAPRSEAPCPVRFVDERTCMYSVVFVDGSMH